jgi:alpha-beta hydrolase superfamily lysophospholipase
MRRLAAVVAGLALLVGALWGFGREGLHVPEVPGFDDPVVFLATREAAYDDLRPGAEARIVWANEVGAPSDLVILYLHGFSAGPEEIRPVPDYVAAALGANLVFARLAGHGRDGAAMAEPRAGDWVADTALFLEIARAVGERVVIIGTSTGGTLAAYAATDVGMATDVAGIVFLSPNFALANPLGALLQWPLARHWVPLVAGRERGFTPVNAAHAAHWTTSYPTVAAVTLGTLMRHVGRRDRGEAEIPALFLFSDADQVVSAQATRDTAARWGGPVTLAPQSLPRNGADPFAHVIAGDILSPSMTAPVTARIVDWIEALPR